MGKGSDKSEAVIGDFGEKAASKNGNCKIGAFGEPVKEQAVEVISEIGDYGEVLPPGEESAGNIGAFGEQQETASLEPVDKIGDFGNSVKRDKNGSAEVGDFGERAGKIKK